MLNNHISLELDVGITLNVLVVIYQLVENVINMEKKTLIVFKSYN